MSTIPQVVCGVIPPHILKRVAESPGHDARQDARATLDHLAELASGRTCTLLETPAAAPRAAAGRPRKRRRVFDARHRFRVPGDLVMHESKPRSADVEATEAWHGSGATYDFFFQLFRRSSIDGRGMSLDSTVHYGIGFENALWNGRQMVYGHADGRLFTRFTASVDVIAHELTHGITQHAASLGYHGQTGALNEHLSDAFGIMVRQYTMGHSARDSDWLIGAEILGPDVRGRGIRSLARPGSAYDDPILGRDPQPSHMRDYVETSEDNGGVHINSGILNHAFYRAAMAIGGKTWHVLGRIWYAALTERLTPDADFADFAQATWDIAGELYGNGGPVQHVIGKAWAGVGLRVPHPGCAAWHCHHRRRRPRAVARQSHRKERRTP